MISTSYLHSSVFFQKNWKTLAATTGCGAVLITTLVLGVLGWLQIISPLLPAALPLMIGSSLLLTTDIAWIIAILISDHHQKKANEPTPVNHFNHLFNDPIVDSQINHQTIDPETTDAQIDDELKIDKGNGFPLVDHKVRQHVIDQTRQAIQTIDKSNYDPYLHHIKYVSKNPTSSDFFPEGDILQTPVKLEYDEKFLPMNSKNFFYMHSTAAPKPSRYTDEADYLNDMENYYFDLLSQQVLSGTVHIFTNYWGMGAFIRRYKTDPQEMFNFRISIARRLANAYCRVVDAYPDYKFTFYIGGPNGDSFPEQYQAEPRDNYNAFVVAFGACASKYIQNVVMCPETDIFVKAQIISDSYDIKPGELAPVSAINASDPHKIGNHWYEGYKTTGSGFNAAFAIEENVFRRSPFLAYIAEKINGALTSACLGVTLLKQNA